MKEVIAHVEEIRPNRHLFVRKFRIGDETSASASIQLLGYHGLCGTERQFHAILPFLHQNLLEKYPHKCIDCYFFDWMGCGQSPLSGEWDAYDSAETEADLVTFVQKHIQPEIPLVIAAHSYGPSIVIRALQNPSLPENIRVNGMVFLGTALRHASSSPLLPDGGHPIMKLPTFLLNYLQPYMTNSFCEMAVHDDHEHIKRIIRQDSDSNDMWMAKCYHRHTRWATFKDLDEHPRMPQRCMVIHGSDDKLIPLELATPLAERLGTQVRVVDRASHLIMIEQPQQVATYLFELLQDVL